MENVWKDKLIALCEGLEIENLGMLLEKGQVKDYYRLGEKMTEEIKTLVESRKLLRDYEEFKIMLKNAILEAKLPKHFTDPTK